MFQFERRRSGVAAWNVAEQAARTMKDLDALVHREHRLRHRPHIAFAFAAFVIVGGFFAQSSYGRFSSTNLGFNLNPKLGWWLMEIPATVVFAIFYLTGPNRFEPTSMVLAAVWLLHYANRGWFFPLSIRQVPGKRSTFNVSVIAMGVIVTSCTATSTARSSATTTCTSTTPRGSPIPGS